MKSTNRLRTTTARAAKLAAMGVASLLISSSPTPATQTVRELFDKIGNSDYITINGLGSGGSTVGLQGTWTTSPSNSTGIVYKDTWSLDWPLGALNDNGILLGHSAGQNGLLNFNSGGNLNSITDPETGLPYGNHSSKSYATRPLAAGAQINCQANGTYYFSVRIVKSYPWWVGDTSAGLGFATGGATNDHFVGIGVTLPSFLLEDAVTDIGNTSYITTGTLGQDGLSNHPWDSGGPYYPRAHGPAGLWTVGDGTHAGLLVGRLTTTTSGAATLEVKSYVRNGDLIDPDPNTISWDATYNFTETNVLTHLLVWMHGQNVLEYDAVRVGTSYGAVIGLELIGAPKGSPANTVYAGTTVTISQSAALNTGAVPAAFQWRTNGVDIVDATNATLVLANPTPAFTANYSVVVSNFYGTLTSPETLITVNPAVAPFYVAQPQPPVLSRYVGAPAATFSVVVDGTPPFTYQWKHAGTNIQPAVTTVNATNTLTVGPITVAEAGSYTVTVTNAFGSTNSAAAILTVLAPPTNTYARALTTVSPNLYAYWRLDENATTNNPTIYDDWGGHNGQVNVDDLSLEKITFGVDGLPYPTFAAPHLATAIGTRGDLWDKPYRLNLSKLPIVTTNMTFTFWVKGGARLMTRNGYAQGYGLENQGGNALRFFWGAYDATNGVKTAQWDTGLSVPENDWAFVALVVNGNNAAVYVGSKITFTSASSADIGGIPDPENGGYMTLTDSTTLGDTAGLSPLAVGRNPWPWADDGNGAPWASAGGTWSDVAVHYQALSAAQIKGLYLAGNGLWIESTPDGNGNLSLNWLPGFTLQEASNATGPWTDIGAATPPYSVPIAPTGNKFYRVKPATL